MKPKDLLTLARRSEHWTTGLTWYQRESDALLDIARELSIDHATACAAASQLSPGVRWETALADVSRLYHDGEATTYGRFRDRARAILQADDPSAAAWGPKTWAFYHNLAFPARRTLVTLDRHHARLHNVPTWTPKRYHDVSGLYAEAAKLGGLLPHQLQAIIWLEVRP